MTTPLTFPKQAFDRRKLMKASRKLLTCASRAMAWELPERRC